MYIIYIIFLSLSIYICTCMCIYIYIYIYVYVRIFINIFLLGDNIWDYTGIGCTQGDIGEVAFKEYNEIYYKVM